MWLSLSGFRTQRVLSTWVSNKDRRFQNSPRGTQRIWTGKIHRGEEYNDTEQVRSIAHIWSNVVYPSCSQLYIYTASIARDLKLYFEKNGLKNVEVQNGIGTVLCLSIKVEYANVDARPCSCLNPQSFVLTMPFLCHMWDRAVVLICGIFLLTDWYPYDRPNLTKTASSSCTTNIHTGPQCLGFGKYLQVQLTLPACFGFLNEIIMVSAWVEKWSQQRCKASHFWDIYPFTPRFLFIYNYLNRWLFWIFSLFLQCLIAKQTAVVQMP